VREIGCEYNPAYRRCGVRDTAAELLDPKKLDITVRAAMSSNG
jgi:hypothetical protein